MTSLHLSISSLASCVVLAAVCTAQTEYFVDAATGSDQNPGTCDRPYQSISFAVTQATAGDTVWIWPGVYSPGTTSELFPIRLGGTRTHTGLQIRGAGPGRTVIDMQGRGGSTFTVSVGADRPDDRPPPRINSGSPRTIMRLMRFSSSRTLPG